jgi:hypothetical protein
VLLPNNSSCLGLPTTRAQVNKLTSSGCVFKFWVADWFALLNNKVRALCQNTPYSPLPLACPAGS